MLWIKSFKLSMALNFISDIKKKKEKEEKNLFYNHRLWGCMLFS